MKIILIIILCLISIPSLLFAQNASLCEQACWACSASDSDLQDKYGSSSIPKRFRFAQRYNEITTENYKRCMAPHGPMAILNRSISGNCTAQANSLCERKCRKDYATSSSSNSSAKNRKLSKSNDRTWHCLCYQENMRGVETESTACRKTAKECWQLHGKIKYGTKILVEGSQGESCYQVKGEHPHLQTSSSKSQWRRSKRAGAWWSPKGCFLNNSMMTSSGESIDYSPPRRETYRSSPSYKSTGSSYKPSRPIGGSCSSLSSCKMSCAQSHCSVVADCINNCMSFSGESLENCVSSSFQTRCSGGY